ncbi:MAG: hypothetical protein FJ242_10770 [Nitrospira sp.]|nr:hypothetical protein [Nitrospira sp.]
MKERSRYETSGLIEAQFEPGSCGRVLRNKLGIKGKREIDKLEKNEQIRTLENLMGMFDKNHRFTEADIRKIHKVWLEKIYEWAGKYRQVNVSKDDFNFAAARQIPRLMDEFEKVPLREYTPCKFGAFDEITKALAVVHTELLLIPSFS